MPDRKLKHGTQRVALTARPQRAKLNADLSTSDEMPDRGRGRLRVQFYVDPLNILVCGVSALEDDLQIECPIAFQFRASIPGSHKMREAAKSRLKNGAAGAPSTKCPEPKAKIDARPPRIISLDLHEEGLRRRSNMNIEPHELRPPTRPPRRRSNQMECRERAQEPQLSSLTAQTAWITSYTAAKVAQHARHNTELH